MTNSTAVSSPSNGAAALIAGSSWAASPGATTVITYSFAGAASVYSGAAAGFSASMTPFSAQDQAVTRAALASIAAVCNVQFVEVADTGAGGTVRYAYSQQPNSMGFGGYAFYPGASDIGGDVWIGRAQAGAEWADYRPNLILHETLHALGLKHPFEGGEVLATADNIIPNTVMSYSPIAGAASGALSSYPVTPMALDIQALQALYGASPANAGDTVYHLDAAGFQQFSALWDAGGTDTLDASACAHGVHLNLAEGARSEVGASVQAFAYSPGGTTTGSYPDTLAIAAGARIENATGSAFDDILVGNALANVLSGGAGDDLLVGGGGNDRMDGGTGDDEAGFTGALANFRIERSGDGYRVIDRAGGQGTDILNGIEKLQFGDMSVDLTMGDAAAAVAAAQLKAVVELYVGFFNRVPEAEGLSYWLGEMAGGMTTGTMAEHFYAAAQQHSGLTGYSDTMSNQDFVKVVYKNVLGRTTVDADGLGYWTQALASGTESRGSLLDSILNCAHTFKGDAQYGWVADLLANKYAVGKAFAVDMGLTWNSADESISRGMEIAAAVTFSDTTEALRLIGVTQQDVALG